MGFLWEDPLTAFGTVSWLRNLDYMGVEKAAEHLRAGSKPLVSALDCASDVPSCFLSSCSLTRLDLELGVK